jgi:Icc-related predicted phosphoesterase
VIAFSDLHRSPDAITAILAAAEAADLVIGAGDFCTMRRGLPEVMAALEPVARKAVYVAGNAESEGELRAATTATVLHGQAATVAGLRLFGLGHAVPVTPFGAWSCDLDEDAAAALLEPLGAVDILVTHAPPLRVCDLTSGGHHAGSRAIRAAIERARPGLCLCGHIHHSWGTTGRIGATTVMNLGPMPVSVAVGDPA